MNAKVSAEQGQVRSNFLELLKEFDTATLVTRALGDGLHGRPMSIAQREEDGTLWFFTDIESAKVAELANDNEALVSLAADSKFIVMTGRVELVKNPEQARALWKEPFRVWFSGPDDPKLALLRFEPAAGEYWNNAGAQGLKHAFRAAKAYIKGEKLQDDGAKDPDIHGKLRP